MTMRILAVTSRDLVQVPVRLDTHDAMASAPQAEHKGVDFEDEKSIPPYLLNHNQKNSIVRASFYARDFF